MEKLKNNSVFIRTLEAKILLLRKLTFISLLAIDIAFSIYLWILWTPDWKWTVNQFWKQTGYVAENLNGTITWLRSNPAGLKLNTPVNESLAWFFTYHIYLWTTFIGFLRSDLFFRLISYALIGGFSTFCSVVYDFSQIFFLHFNCFDAYATKLCYLCYYTLSVLWNLVRGNKWNPLRGRKDTVTLDTRQQFLATSLFVILLFIIPTVFVYFVVFRCLRISVSVLQTIIYFFATWPFQFYALGIHFAEKYGFRENSEKLETS
uniref:PMT_2 domain-containing protein n=1 Tax=Caenorhabditis tropicalis TaxID=1561998 RepID=A0A1I7UCT6_9PELO